MLLCHHVPALRLCYGHVTDLIAYYGDKHTTCQHPETAGPSCQPPVDHTTSTPKVWNMPRSPAEIAAKERLVTVVGELG